MKSFVLPTCLSWRVLPALLVAEANWTKEKPEDNGKVSAGQEALATATCEPSGMGLVRVRDLEVRGVVQRGVVPRGLPLGTASKENRGVQRAWGPVVGDSGADCSRQSWSCRSFRAMILR